MKVGSKEVNVSLFDPNSFYYPYPKGVPKGLVKTLVIGCLLLGLAGLSKGEGLQGWLIVFENWLMMLLIIPTAVSVVALPFKYRDPTFELKNAYWMGMFVALLFTLGKLRYLR